MKKYNIPATPKILSDFTCMIDCNLSNDFWIDCTDYIIDYMNSILEKNHYDSFIEFSLDDSRDDSITLENMIPGFIDSMDFWLSYYIEVFYEKYAYKYT